jgi:hypothetical protein
MYRVLGLAAGAIVVAVSVIATFIAVDEWKRNAALRKMDRARAKTATVAVKPQPPPLPPLPPAVDPAEVARIVAAGKPRPPRGRKEDYTWQQIEAILEQLRKDRPQRPQALDDLESWYRFLSTAYFTNSMSVDEHLAVLKSWRDELPNSPTPLVVLAKFYISYAWEARGSGFAFTVTEEGWQLFHERISKAQELLDEAVALGPQDGEAYALLVTIAKAEGLSVELARSFVDAGRKIDPSYGEIYIAMAENLLPRWHGEPGDIQEFAKEISELVSGDDGLDAYGQIAYRINQYEPDQLFYGGYDRRRLAKAAEVLARRYPQARNLVPFAALCTVAAQDHAAARRVQPFVRDDDAPRVPGWKQASREYKQWCDTRDVPTDEKDWIWGTHTTYGNIAFDSDPRFVWCGQGASVAPVKLLDQKTKKVELQLVGPGGSLNDLAFDGRKNWLAGIVANTEFKGWVLWKTKNPDDPIVHATDELPRAIAISPKSEQLAWGMPDKKVHTWDVRTQTEGPTIEAPNYAHFLRYSDDGKLLAIDCSQISVWDAVSGEKKYELPHGGMQPRAKVWAERVVAFDDQQQVWATALVVGISNARPLLRFAPDGQSWETIVPDLGEHGHACAITSDYRQLAVAELPSRSGPEGIKVFDLSTGKMTKRLGGHWNHIGALAFSPDGKQLASIAQTGGAIKIWSLDDEPKQDGKPRQ